MKKVIGQSRDGVLLFFVGKIIDGMRREGAFRNRRNKNRPLENVGFTADIMVY